MSIFDPLEFAIDNRHLHTLTIIKKAYEQGAADKEKELLERIKELENRVSELESACSALINGYA